LLSYAVFGCASAHFETKTEPEKRKILSQIVQRCGLRPLALTLAANGNVRIDPGSGATFSSIDCAIKKLNRVGVTMDKMVFVGNEAWPEQRP